MSAPNGISVAAAAEVRFIAARRLNRLVAALGTVSFAPESSGPFALLYQDTVAEGVPANMQRLVDKLEREG